MTINDALGWAFVLVVLLFACLIAVAVVASARATWKDWHKP